MEQTESIGEKSPRIRRGRVDSLSLYEITDNELDALAKGSPTSLYLNFAICLLSTATSFLIALLTSTITNEILKVFIVVIVVVGYILGVLLLLLWLRSRKSVGGVVKRIKQRIPKEETEENETESKG